jgi:regulator of sigma E protease
LKLDTLLSKVPFVVILVAMIVIHEFGHFIVAKMLGIAVETFSVGFGPRLVGFRYGETDYRISAIPLGGYVKFRGENLEMLQGKSEGSIDEFLAHPKWKRLLVAAAGPVFNIATAILIPTAAILIGYQESVFLSQKVVIGEVKAGSTAEQAGLQRGDRIVSYFDKQNPTWEEFIDDVRVRPNETIPLTIERNGQRLSLTLKPRVETLPSGEQFGDVDIDNAVDGIGVGSLTKGYPAEAAGLKPGDKITEINGKPITALSQFRRTLNESNGQPVTLKVARGGQTLEVKVAPRKDEKPPDYRLGFVINNTTLVKTSSISSALAYGWKYNWRIMKLTGVIFRQIFAGQRSARDSVSGPIGIMDQTADTFRIAGWSGVISLMGLLSLNLGIVNLLPIPVLDGGVILLILIEGLLGLVGLTLTLNMRERFQQVGFVMVLLLMAFVIGNDLLRKFSRPVVESPPAQQPNK